MSKMHRTYIRILLTVCIVVTTVLLVAFLAGKPPLLDNINFSRAVFDRHGQLLRLTLTADQKYRLFTPLKDISPQFREAVLLHEDKYFYDHFGINPVSLIRAFLHTYVIGGRKIGASTISMQLARMAYGINSRHVTGKLLQILRALQLEAHYSKDQLLEAYLNRASYGYNIEGVGAASTIYFHVNPQNLTLPEAMTLAVIPQSPARRRPDRNNPAKPLLIEARNQLSNRWIETHPADSVQKPFFALPLAYYGVADLPFELPQLTHELLSKYRHRAQITASVDLDTQQLLTGILRKYVDDRCERGIRNATALLVDTQTMNVMACVGSADFMNRSINGQVDGTKAKRSPGSTLKPFIYALALDQGLIHPLSILGDVPVNFGSYAPDNFDRDFRGPISARDALRLSRNIPAIKLASKLHAPDLYDFLKTAGVAGLRDKASYGLSLVLGGAEVTERELAELYAMLANDGVLRPLVFQLTEAEPVSGKPLLSPEASFITLDMLADKPRAYTLAHDRIVYWKTGTSNGFHDAWTAGVFGHYALVVWIGNFNGMNNPALIGVRVAAPLFFSMVDAINEKEPNRELISKKVQQHHLHLRKIDVCATTGDLSSENCPAHDSIWFIPGVSPIHNLNVYRKILVDLRTGERACYFQPGVTSYRTFEVWPSDLLQTLQKAGIQKEPLPPWQKNCLKTGVAAQVEGNGQKPVITSPQPSVEYHAHINDTGEAVSFNANADGEVRTLHWFINNQYLGNSKPDESFSWHPRPGQYHVRVVDDHGRFATTIMQVVLTQ